MNSPLFLDVNVWVALNSEVHSHHATAKRWYEAIPPSATIVICRQTQLGLFRIMTTAAVMGEEVLTQLQCWRIYDQWLSTGQVAWADEPRNLEAELRVLTAGAASSPKTWMDAYLAAFAEAGNLTLVTFDCALAGKVNGALLLG
jgi:toxin-antitoxin system PIN domain toxin